MEAMHNERLRIAMLTLAMLISGVLFTGCGAKKEEAPKPKQADKKEN